MRKYILVFILIAHSILLFSQLNTSNSEDYVYRIEINSALPDTINYEEIRKLIINSDYEISRHGPELIRYRSRHRFSIKTKYHIFSGNNRAYFLSIYFENQRFYVTPKWKYIRNYSSLQLRPKLFYYEVVTAYEQNQLIDEILAMLTNYSFDNITLEIRNKPIVIAEISLSASSLYNQLGAEYISGHPQDRARQLREYQYQEPKPIKQIGNVKKREH